MSHTDILAAVLAYKFLDADGRAPFTGTLWPRHGWVEVSQASPCHQGVHACRAADVAIWIAAAMWVVELDGEVIEARHKLVATRGRLVAPVPGYDEAIAELNEVCAWRSRARAVAALRRRRRFVRARRFARASTLERLAELGGRCDDSTVAGRLGALAGDAAREAIGGVVARAPFVAACSAGHDAAGRADDQDAQDARDAFDAGYQAERDFQSAWLTRRLTLT